MNDRALKVLEQYELEVKSVRRGRGSYILETTQGLRILSDYTGSENKALFQNCVMNSLRQGGYMRVDMLLPNKEGSLISKDWEEKKYVLKEWYTGSECDTSSEGEILAAVSNLARIHRLMVLEGEEKYKQSFTAQSPLAEIQGQNAEMKKIRTFIRKKNAKGDFERLFLERFPRYFEQAQEAEECLRRSCGDGSLPGNTDCVCHGDYDHHHILMAGYEVATTNFECCRFDCQINDLYRFMRKILEKNEWNARLGMRMLDHYTEIRPVSQTEKRLLYVRMLYPEKFRKLANYYYGSNKAWISRRYLDKLEKLNGQEEKKAAFLRQL